MFEKSLVDLIRGLRGHKGRETEYIQSALKECRAEIRSQDMDVKATALLKLIYLEMFGYDMTWAAFNVLEVMSAPKHMQKRVGYLGAVQSFRPNTDVLMLAENLLKKDLSSPSIPTLMLPLVTLPHIITPSLALSILTDLLPRLSHSQPGVRKKTIVTLYRLALVYPETLRVAWPKIKERLLNEEEDSSVTAATVNVVCELGWRRPQDFLPLAPRLFDLLIDGGNNWMAIKIIKLFAVLTPLEPRLIKKLVRPLTNLIQTTTAMSLLYECISGIIQGGILDGADAGVDVEEVADLCISKLRGMIVLEGDPNLKYVALLAFNKIVGTHSTLVSMQQDVILACLDDPDISIRLQALELTSGMVSSDTLQGVVDKLLKQLANAPTKERDDAGAGAEDENTDLEQRLVPDKRSAELPPLPDEYRQEVITRVLDMCSSNTYANVTDFEWYIEVLVRLIRFLPSTSEGENDTRTNSFMTDGAAQLASRIGSQLLDVVVRVRELRLESVKAAESLTLLANRGSLYSSSSNGLNEILQSTIWVCGEFASCLSTPYDVFNSLVHKSTASLAPATLAISVQAIPKVFAQIVSVASREWNASRKSTMSLMLARAVELMEELSTHPNLEVQERNVEFLELLKVCTEALNSLPNDALEAPLLLTSAIPELFSGQELNPVAVSAQSKVPMPSDLDLDEPINLELMSILQASQLADAEDDTDDAVFNSWYYERDVAPATTTLQPRQTSFQPSTASQEDEPISYQAPQSPETLARLKAERLARNKDDPFYIPSAASGTSTPSRQIHDIIARSNENDDLDIDSIPIIDLQIDANQTTATSGSSAAMRKKKKKPSRKYQIAADETFDSFSDSAQTPASQPSRSTSRSPARGLMTTGLSNSTPSSFTQSQMTRNMNRPNRNLLSVDSTSLGSVSLSLSDSPADPNSQLEIERRLAEEAEMAAALKEVERKRMELAREEERKRTVYREGVEEGGAIVKRKKKKKKPTTESEAQEGNDNNDDDDVDAATVVKKKKKKSTSAAHDGNGERQQGEYDEGTVVAKKKKKKVKKVKKSKDASTAGGSGGGDDDGDGQEGSTEKRSADHGVATTTTTTAS